MGQSVDRVVCRPLWIVNSQKPEREWGRGVRCLVLGDEGLPASGPVLDDGEGDDGEGAGFPWRGFHSRKLLVTSKGGRGGREDSGCDDNGTGNPWRGFLLREAPHGIRGRKGREGGFPGSPSRHQRVPLQEGGLWVAADGGDFTVMEGGRLIFLPSSFVFTSLDRVGGFEQPNR